MKIHYFHDGSHPQALALTERLTALGFTDITIEESYKNPLAEMPAFAGQGAKSGSVPGLSAA